MSDTPDGNTARSPGSRSPRPSPSFRVRTWLVLLVTACVLPLALFCMLLLYQDAKDQAGLITRQVQDRARLLAEDIDREVSRIVAGAEVLATAGTLIDGNFEAFYRRAVQVRDLLGTNILVRDLTSQQLVNTRVPWGTPLPRNDSFEVDRRAIETGEPQVSGLLTGAVARTPLLIVVVPVPRGGEPRYLLSLTIGLDRLQAIISPERLPEGWVAGMVDRDGILIGRSHRPREFVGTRLRDDLWARMRDLPQSIQSAESLDGVPSLQAYQRSEVAGWLVGVSVPESLVAAPWRRTLALFAGGGALLFLIGLSVALLVGRRLAHQIADLAGSAEALGAGRPVAVPGRGVVEIEAMGDALRGAADLIGKREAALTESEARLRRVVEGAPFPIIVHAEGGEIVHVSRTLIEATGYRRDEIATLEGWERRAFVAEGRDGTLGTARVVALDRPIDEGEFQVRTADGRTRVWSFRSAKIGRDSRDRRLVVTMAADLTERKEAEASLHLLMREVDHRAKNALAVVQSIMQLSRSDDPAAFIEAVQGRVAAMARVHTLLATTRWSGADLEVMLQAELEALAGNGRVGLSGTPVSVVAEAAQAISIVLHELATNAAKHGALSVPAGRVAVSWSVDPGDGKLVVDWREEGGPPVSPPTRSSFGTFVIDRTIKGQLRGDLSRDWRRTGLCLRMTLPPDCFRTSGVRAPALPAAPRPAEDQPRKPIRNAAVMIVEDEALTATAMARELETAGYRVLGPVGRLQEAIELARTSRPDAAVLDVNLFGQPSYPVASVLDDMGVPFLFCTGYGSLNEPDGRFDKAAVLTKPVSPTLLRDAVASLLTAGVDTEVG
ncbi:PAS domain S-box protein (plasmid) [Skermanella rosea]|uniref:HWE histidine kinase domain-containing protein n=1 Tax=Skermanella rosea TaxID=1817965 RepID=UPI001933EF86|nr:HWE histidine kinase domain-containing protein [Skermanella rosea]UEM06944.1 PAS domain S-box protein [Skermanella rosea]